MNNSTTPDKVTIAVGSTTLVTNPKWQRTDAAEAFRAAMVSLGARWNNTLGAWNIDAAKLSDAIALRERFPSGEYQPPLNPLTHPITMFRTTPTPQPEQEQQEGATQSRTPFITSRGNPDGPTFDGKELETVHMKEGSGEQERPACRNGAYNLRWTTRLDRVTCPACLAKLAQ